MEPKECPMCGGTMRLRVLQQTDRVPGTREARTKPAKEWNCPECDYFEDAEES
jgi:transposase